MRSVGSGRSGGVAEEVVEPRRALFGGAEGQVSSEGDEGEGRAIEEDLGPPNPKEREELSQIGDDGRALSKLRGFVHGGEEKN